MASLKTNILYVADLPKEINSDDIKKLFESYHFQYASLNSSKSAQVWAQVFLESEEYCTKARHELNGTIIKGKPIRICNFDSKGKGNYSTQASNESLLVKNIDPRVTQKEFYQLFLKFGDINSAKLEYDDMGISKGFGYICYYDEKSAESAKSALNNKEYYGKNLEIVNLIPFKSNSIHNNNSLYVTNFPTEFKEDDLKKLFSKYGDVKFVSIYKTKTGISKGCGAVSFAEFESANKCILELKENQITFPGLLPLTVGHVKSKEERIKKVHKDESTYTKMKVQFSMLYSTAEINNEKDLEKEIRLFIKVVLLEEYNPKDVEVDFKTFSGIVTFNTKEDFENYLQKYEEFVSLRPTTLQPTFECFPVIPVPQNPFMANPDFNNNNGLLNNLNTRQAGSNPLGNSNNLLGNSNSGLNANINAAINSLNNLNLEGSNLLNKDTRNSQAPLPNMNNFEINSAPQMPQMQLSPNMGPNMGQNMGLNFQQSVPPRMPMMNQPIGQQQPIYGQINLNNRNQSMPPKIMPNSFMGMNNMNRVNQPMFPNQPNNANMMEQSGPSLLFNNPQRFQPRQFFKIKPKKPFNNNRGKGNMNRNNQMQFNNANMAPRMNMQQQNLANYMIEPDINDTDKQSEEIDHRNLENLDPAQLHSQFNTNKPVQHLFNPETCNIDENEDLANEIADSIYEIAFKLHPKEASKITGMIKEKGIHKMNMLLSKKEDLIEIIEKGYDMIIKSENN